LGDQVFRMPPVTGFAIDGVPGGEESSGHVSAHAPEADEAELGLDLCFLHYGSFLFSLSQPP
jgi:hypothetical protein